MAVKQNANGIALVCVCACVNDEVVQNTNLTAEKKKKMEKSTIWESVRKLLMYAERVRGRGEVNVNDVCVCVCMCVKVDAVAASTFCGDAAETAITARTTTNTE